MEDVTELLRVIPTPPVDFTSWKRTRNRMVKELKPKMLSLSEANLVNLSNHWDEEEKLRDSSEDEIMRKLVIVFVNFFYFRNLDTIANDISQFIHRATTASEMVVKGVFNTIRSLSDYSNEGSFLSKDVFAEMQKLLEKNEPKTWFCIAYGLYQASKYLSTAVMHFVMKWWQEIIEICLEGTSETSRYCAKLLKFQLEYLNEDNNTDTLIDLKNLCEGVVMKESSPSKTEAALVILGLLLERFRGSISVDLAKIYEAVKPRYQEFPLSGRNALLSLMRYCDHDVAIDMNALFQASIDAPLATLEIILERWKDKIDCQLSVNFIESEAASGKLCCGSYCKLILLRKLMKEVPTLKVNPEAFENLIPCCLHYVDCMIDNETLLTDKYFAYFRDVLENPDEKTERDLMASLRIFRKYRERFENHRQLVDKWVAIAPRVSVEARKEIVESIRVLEDVDERNHLLLTMAVTDLDRLVRLLALEYVTVTPRLAYNPLIYQPVSDNCFKVRRKMMQILEDIYTFNPIDGRICAYDLIDQSFRNIVAHPDTDYAAKTASLLSILAAHCSVCDYCAKDHANNIITICLDFLSTYEEVADVDNEKQETASGKGSLPNDETKRSFASYGVNMSISSDCQESKSDSFSSSRSSGEDQVSIGDTLVKAQSFTQLTDRQMATKPLQANIYRICSQAAKDKRDEYLIECLGSLGKRCEPYLNRILKVFSTQFAHRTNTHFLIVAVRSLCQLASSVFNGLNIRLRCPELVTPLFRILANTKSHELVIEILKLFGNAFDSVQGEERETFRYPTFYITEDVYTDYVMNTILEHMGEPSIRSLKAMAMIVESDPEHAARFAPKIIPMYLRAIDKFSSVFRPSLFGYLTVICRYLRQEIIPLLPSIQPLILRFIDSEDCVRFCASLAFQYCTELIAMSNELFAVLLSKISFCKSLKYFSYSLKFLTFAVIRQNQSFDLLLLALENLRNLSQGHVTRIVKCLTIVSQNIDMKLFRSRVCMFVSRLPCDVTNLVNSLILWQDLSPVQAKCLFPSMDFSEVIEFKKNLIQDKRDAPFIEVITPSMKVQKMIKPIELRKPFFSGYSYPDETDVKKMLTTLTRDVIENSPYPQIRSCCEFFNFRSRLLRRLFPLAFLAVWKLTDPEDRKHFSQIVQRIIHEHAKVDGIWLILIQFLDKNYIPFDIDCVRVADIAQSHPLAFFFLHREYMRGNVSVLPKLMSVCQKMNRIATLNSYYRREVTGDIDICDRARFCGILGDWDQALKLFKEAKARISHVIGCLEKLKRYDDILDLEKEYNAITDWYERTSSTGALLWSLFLYRENTKIERLLESANLTKDANVYYFEILYLISIKKYDEAQRVLNEAYSALARDRIRYTTGDQYQLQEKLNYAQLFYEGYEVLTHKLSGGGNNEGLCDIWSHRVKFFRRNEMIWERLIVLRNLVLPIQSNLVFYLKMIAAIRKSGYFNLIDEYFTKHFEYYSTGNVVIERLKIAWARGDREACLATCKTGVGLIQSENKEDWIRTMTSCELLFPFVVFIQLSRQPGFNSDMRDYVAQYFDVSSMSNALPLLQSMKREHQKRFLITLINQFPDQIYACAVSNIRSETFEPGYFYGINYLYAKFLLQLRRNSFHAYRISAKYFRKALDHSPDAYKSWCGLGAANLGMFTLLRENPEAAEESEEIDDFEEPQTSESDIGIPSKQIALTMSQYDVREAFVLDEMHRREVSPSPITICDPSTVDSGTMPSFGSAREASSGSPRPGSAPADLLHRESNNQFTSGSIPSMLYPNPARPQSPRTRNRLASADCFGINALMAFLKAIELKPSKALRHLFQLLHVLFSLKGSPLLTNELLKQVSEIPSRLLVKVIPQLTVQIANEDPRIQNLVVTILESISKTNYQDVFFPLNLSASDGSSKAAEVLSSLRSKNEKTSADADLFVDGMVRSACTWFESWKLAVEAASRVERYRDEILAAKFKELSNPKCEIDEFFIGFYGPILMECKSLFEEHTKASLQLLWERLRRFYDHVKDRVNKLCTIILSKISVPLAKKRGFALTIPGDSSAMLESVEPVMEIMGTQQHPRITYFTTNTGNRVKFLLKGNEDLRLDERLMQFFALVNTLANGSYTDVNISISCYAVVPLTKTVGLIRWFTGADTIHQLVLEDRERRKFSATRESEICSEFSDAGFKDLHALQRLELFYEIEKECKAMELYDLAWLRAPNASVWVKMIEGYTESNALMSMIGYIIGLGDRHPSNIMIQKTTGTVVHIDFGEAFESTLIRTLFPEKVPFRLTRLLVNALEGAAIYGLYESVCVNVMKLLRKHRNILSAQLAIFLQEPLDLPVMRMHKSSKEVMNRVILKLEGKELSPDEKEIPVEEQVHRLIETAANPANYVRHYAGWCPFW